MQQEVEDERSFVGKPRHRETGNGVTRLRLPSADSGQHARRCGDTDTAYRLKLPRLI